MKVDVYAYYGDTCGNSTEHYYATYECDSLEQAEKIFAHGFLCGWRVYEHTRIIRKLPTKPPQFPTEQDMERGQFKPAEFER
jgi:hypothetical protein